MPSPTLLEWCSTSITSIQQSVQQILNSYSKSGVQVPSEIIQIQGLRGLSPGEKYKSFNEAVNTIVESVKNGSEIESELHSVNTVLLELTKTNVGIKLRLNDFIIESLKSENSAISRKALSAHWFFEGDNPNVTADRFSKDILPYVSVRTRLDIVKKLSRGLQGHQNKAREFFVKLVDLYGVQENLRILTACAENFIFESILRYKIVLPVKILRVLYSKYPDLVVNYLQLGNNKNTDNSSDRKMHQINIHDYDTFLPELIRQQPLIFVTLYELTPEKNLGTLSHRRSTLLLSNAKQAILSRPDVHLKLLQAKIVKAKLTAVEIETMLENYLPKDVTDFSLDVALEFVDNYLGDDKIQVLISKFEKIYDKNLLEYARKIIESNTKATKSGLKLLRKLSTDERQSQINILLKNVDKNSELKDVLMSYLNPSESLPYFKDKLSKSSSTADERIQHIGCMIVSCGVQNSKKDLLTVLQHYQERHTNEGKLFLCQFFEYLKSEFDLKTLEEPHWAVLRNIINYAHIKKELFASHEKLITTVLEAMLRHAMTCKRRNDRHVEEAMEMIVECKVENVSPGWNVLEENLVLQKECLENFFSLIPVKYPTKQHYIWKQKNNRLALALSLLKSLRRYNVKCAKDKRINLKDYPWILKLTEEFISRSETGFRKELLMKLLKQQAPEFYEAKLNENPAAVRDIASGEALQLLRVHPEKVLEHWQAYLNEARDKLQDRDKQAKSSDQSHARRFVAATRWHHELPVKFIEACLTDMKTDGSLAVLGILLPGEIFEKVVATSASKPTEAVTKESFQLARSVLRAAKWTNPPVSLESLRAFCRDEYVTIADGAFASLATRVCVASAVEFAKKLTCQPRVSLAKRGVRLAKGVATNQQFRDVLVRVWSSSTDVSMRRRIARMIFRVFLEFPHPKNWELMVSCLRGLTLDDREIVQDLSDIEKVDVAFVSGYIEEYVSKVEELFAASLDFKWRTKCVCLLVESFDEKLTSDVSEEVMTKILDRYFFDADCSDISRATRTFAVRYYLLSSGGQQFRSRLNVILNILRKTIESFDVPHPKKRRFYPANYTVQDFFTSLLNELSCSDSDDKLHIVESVLNVFNTSNLSPWQEPSSFISLNLYKEYLHSTSPEDFGIRIAKRIDGLIEDFAGNEPIDDIADCLNDLLISGKIFRDQKNPHTLKLSLIEGLLQSDLFYGALTSVKLLDSHHVEEYDERYERVVSTLRQKKNSFIIYNLYRHLNNLPEQ